MTGRHQPRVGRASHHTSRVRRSCAAHLLSAKCCPRKTVRCSALSGHDHDLFDHHGRKIRRPVVESPLLQRRRPRPRIGRHRFKGDRERCCLQYHSLGPLQTSPDSSSSSSATADRVVEGDSLSRRAKLRRDLRRLVSQNCRGLKTTGHVSELIAVLRRRRVFAACLQETWREGAEELLEEGWLFVGSAPAAQRGRGSMGVGIMLSPLAAKALDTRHDDLGPRVVAVRLLAAADPRARRGSQPAQPLGIFLVSGYAPQSTADEDDWDAYYYPHADRSTHDHPWVARSLDACLLARACRDHPLTTHPCAVIPVRPVYFRVRSVVRGVRRGSWALYSVVGVGRVRYGSIRAVPAGTRSGPTLGLVIES